MKKYIALICTFLTIFSVFAIPANAADLSSTGWFDVLDIAYMYSATASVDGYSYAARVQERTYDVFEWELPQYTDCVYMDILFRTDSNNPSIKIGGTKNLTVELISDDDYKLYRAYGRVYSYVEKITLTYTWSGGYWLDILSFNVCSTEPNGTAIEAYCQIGAVDVDENIHYIPTDLVNSRVFTGTDDSRRNFVYLDIFTFEWEKYDRIDVQLDLWIQSIQSISASLDGVNIPLETSYIEAHTINGNRYLVTISMDLSTLDKTSTSYPIININGRVQVNMENQVDFVSCRGFVTGTDLNPISLFLRKIIDKISSLISQVNTSVHSVITKLTSNFTNLVDLLIANFNSLTSSIQTQFQSLKSFLSTQTSSIITAIKGDSAAADDFKDDITEKDSALKDMAGVMGSVSMPELDSVDVDANSFVDGNVLAISTSGVSAVLAMPIFSDVIVMAILLATAGYVLFGKR